MSSFSDIFDNFGTWVGENIFFDKNIFLFSFDRGTLDGEKTFTGILTISGSFTITQIDLIFDNSFEYILTKVSPLEATFYIFDKTVK